MNQRHSIPFNRSSIEGRELEYISHTIGVGQVAGDQTYSRKCQKLLEKTLGVKRAFVTTSCTHALEMAAMLLQIAPGDEVIVPSFTFVSTANAFVLRGARPIFCDIRADTLNLDETRLESLISIRTKAIIVVHYAGVGCAMDEITAIAKKHGIPLVEDNAHGLFGKYKGRWLGSMGVLSTQSFHETKNITCGEGGALLINDQRYINRAEIIREKGTDRSKFFRGQVDKYSWVDLGSSYVMSDILAAFLYGQLEKWESIQRRRKQIWDRYQTRLRTWGLCNGIGQPFIPTCCEQAYHLYYILLPSTADRARLIARLKQHGILAVFHYLPLHLSQYARQWRGKRSNCPVTEDISGRLLRLPLFPALSIWQQNRVIEVISEFEA